MVVISEDIRESNTESEGGDIVPAAETWPKQLGGSMLFRRRHCLSVTFLRNRIHGAIFKLFQAPEMTRNLRPFPSYSQLMLCLEAARITSKLCKKDSVKMIEWNNTDNCRTQISKTLREVVKRAVMEFRLSSCSNPDEMSDNDVVEAVPISFKTPKDGQFDAIKMDVVLSQRKRLTTLVVGETLISFKLPEDCTFDPTEVDKLPVPEAKDQMTPNAQNNVRKYTIFQRLESWKMERRQRSNGRFDMYYYHQQSKRMFRSITEVVNFLLYEVYPEKPQRSAGKEKIGEDDLSDKKCAKQKGITPLKRKVVGNISPNFASDDQRSKSREKMHPIYNVVGEEHKATVEQFLADAYDNLINWPEQKDTSFSFYNNEESDANDGSFSPHETVEELMAAAYENLVNHSNDEPNMPKGEEKRRCIEKPKRILEVETFTSTLPSVSNMPSEVNVIPIERTEDEKEKEQKKEEAEKEKEREEEEEKIINTVTSIPDLDPAANPSTVESSPAAMEVEEASTANVQHKRFNIREVDGHVIFSEIEYDPNYPAGGEHSSPMEIAKSVALSHMDECDLINHIPESPEMFELALFLSNHRNNGGFI